jgi:hypothetical protein
LPATGIIRAIAVSAAVSSIGVSAIYNRQSPALTLVPASVSLTVSQARSFAATVSGISNSAVTWSLNPSIGSVSASGVYTAPTSISTAQTVEVIATSAADLYASASATVSLVPPTRTTLIFLSSPSSTTAASLLEPTVSVAIEDGKGNIITNTATTVSIALGSKSPSGTLAGILTQPAVQGIATFSGLTITAPGTGYRLLATSVGLSSATSAPFTITAAKLPLFPSKMADKFVDSVGLNVHFSYYGSIYTNLSSQLIQDIGQLGVRHLRDQMAWEGTVESASPFYTIHNQLALKGVKTDYILTSITYPMSQVAAYPTLVNDMEAAEPANEFDASGDPNWIEKITGQETSLYQQMNSSSRTSAMTVLSPSLAQPANAAQLGKMGRISDAGNSHAYFGGWNPGNSGSGGANNPAYFMNLAEMNNPGQPIWVSETGFWTLPGAYYGGYGSSEAAQATYEPRALLDFWNAGAARTYLYELADYAGNLYWGLLREDGSAKPSFGAIQNLLQTLTDPGQAFTPDPLAYSLTGGDSQIQRALFQKRDGSYYLAIWVEAESYNFLTQTGISVPAQTVTLQLGRSVLSASTYQLTSAGTMTETTLTPSQQLQLSVTDRVQIVKLVLQ